jgi:hypothetical protein
MPERVSFVCRACQMDTGSVAPRTRMPAWATLWGFAHCLYWLAEPPAAEAGAQLPLYLPATPSARGMHWLSVRKPFHGTLGEDVWCLYQPPLSYYNGWEHRPDEIARSALVLCELCALREVGDYSALAQVRVSDVLAFPEIGERLPAGETIGASVLEQTVPSIRREAVRCGSYSYLSVNFEGDVGAWAVVEARGNRQFLIVAGEWGWHEDFAFAGNAPLDQEAIRALHAILDAGG